MEIKEASFNLRFSLIAPMPDALLENDEFEETAWLQEWETRIKPGLLQAVFAHLRSFPGWQAHVRNRGISPADEVEIVFERKFEA